jgi:hypothetical protein
MRKTAFAGTAILAVSLMLTACGTVDDASDGPASEETTATEPQAEETTDESAEEPTAEARSGDFEGLNDKSVAGSVEVTGTEVVFSGFTSDEGPDLHVYLTNGTEAADVAAGVEVDLIDFAAESQTFELDGVDVAGYDTVVIHCDKAKAVFGAAPLA